MKSFRIEDGKAIMRDMPTCGWLRKEDVIYEIQSTIDIYKDQLRCWCCDKEKDSNHIKYTEGKIDGLTLILNEIKNA